MFNGGRVFSRFFSSPEIYNTVLLKVVERKCYGLSIRGMEGKEILKCVWIVKIYWYCLQSAGVHSLDGILRCLRKNLCYGEEKKEKLLFVLWRYLLFSYIFRDVVQLRNFNHLKKMYIDQNLFELNENNNGYCVDYNFVKLSRSIEYSWKYVTCKFFLWISMCFFNFKNSIASFAILLQIFLTRIGILEMWLRIFSIIFFLFFFFFELVNL